MVAGVKMSSIGKGFIRFKNAYFSRKTNLVNRRFRDFEYMLIVIFSTYLIGYFATLNFSTKLLQNFPLSFIFIFTCEINLKCLVKLILIYNLNFILQCDKIFKIANIKTQVEQRLLNLFRLQFWTIIVQKCLHIILS